LYRWLGQQYNEDERRVTFKEEEKQDKEPPLQKEAKEAIETIVEGLLEPKISDDETKEYERYFLVKGNY